MADEDGPEGGPSLSVATASARHARSSNPHTRTSSRAPSVRRQETDDSEKAGRAWAREPEEDPWAPCFLTLDGGGIRGYSSLLILKELMHWVFVWEGLLDSEEGVTDQDGSEVRREEDLLPCHYFDFMYGTSTGGLIAIILSRLRMTVAEALELYRTVGDDLFGKRRSSVPLMTKYHHQPLEKAVRDIVRRRCHDHSDCDGEDIHPWNADRLDTIKQLPVPFDVDDPRVCQSCCLTATHGEDSTVVAHLLRSYPHYYSDTSPNYITTYNEGADELPIWQVTRATTAAPFYFEMLRAVIDGDEKCFKDGGIRENNPSGAAMSEFRALYDGRVSVPALLLSVGTGRPDQTQDGFATSTTTHHPSSSSSSSSAQSSHPGLFGRLPFVSKFLEKRAVIQNLLIKYTDGERQHFHMREFAQGEHTWYKRLNVSDGLQHVPLDDWVRGPWSASAADPPRDVPGGASLSRMEAVTTAYLEREFDPIVDSYAPPATMLRQAAEKMVRQRRAREKLGGVRWEVFVGRMTMAEADERRMG